MDDQKKKIDFNFTLSQMALENGVDALFAAKLKGMVEGYKAACHLNSCIDEPWSEENRERNELYKKGVIEGQDVLHSFLGTNDIPVSLSEWEDDALLEQFTIGYLIGFDQGFEACCCTADSEDGDSGATTIFNFP